MAVKKTIGPMELERDGLGKSTGCSCRGQGFTVPGGSHLTVIAVPEDLMGTRHSCSAQMYMQTKNHTH